MLTSSLECASPCFSSNPGSLYHLALFELFKATSGQLARWVCWPKENCYVDKSNMYQQLKKIVTGIYLGPCPSFSPMEIVILLSNLNQINKNV